MVSVNRLADGFRWGLLAESMRHVRKMAAGSRNMSLQGLGREVAGPSAADGGHEVRQMGSLQRFGSAVIRDILDLLTLLIEERSSGSVAGEITALTVDNHAAGLA